MVVGDGFAKSSMADAPVSRIEFVVGDMVGRELKAEVLAGQVRELVVGDGVGVDTPAGVVSAIIDVVIAEAPFKLAQAILETVVRSEGEDLTVQRIAAKYVQAVSMVRTGLPVPSTVRSLTTVASLRQQTLQQAVRAWARSSEFAATLRHQTIMRRAVEPLRSQIRTGTLRMMAVQSRSNVYVPSSGVYAKSLRQMSVTLRQVQGAPAMWSPIRMFTLAQMTVQSRIERTPVILTDAFVNSLAHMTLLARQVSTPVITTDALVKTLAAQVLMATSRTAPFSRVESKSLIHMTVLHREVLPPGINERVASYRQQIALARVPAPTFGGMTAKHLRMLSVSSRVPALQFSSVIASKLQSMVAQHRVTYPPKFALGRQVYSLIEQAVVSYAPLKRRSPINVMSMSIRFVLHRDTPRPIDVIDPAIGRHAYTLTMLTVMHRETEPPTGISKESRLVYNLFAQVAVRDKFDPAPIPEPEPSETFVEQVIEVLLHRDPEPWSPVSALTARVVFEAIALGDDAGWSDPTIPVSAVQADGVMQAVAVGDVFPGSEVSQSDAMVAGVQAVLAIGDSTMPDPTIPLSEIQANGVIEFAAVGDADWVDPTIPVSDVLAQRVTAFLALRDPSLSGVVGGSEIMSPSVMQFYVTRDPTMKGVALRSGPRPIISVTIS